MGLEVEKLVWNSVYRGVSSELCKLVKSTKHRRVDFGKEEEGADA